jgi:hypothetical protein
MASSAAQLPGGALALMQHGSDVRIRIPPGTYKVYCRAYNLGSEDRHGSSDLSGEEFFQHDECERYEIILVPRSTEKEGDPEPVKAPP